MIEEKKDSLLQNYSRLDKVYLIKIYIWRLHPAFCKSFGVLL